jgi:large subunit ribosomal protein L22
MERNNPIIKAINKNVRTSPRKLALVCNFIKGKRADIALRDLEFTRKKIAKDVSKTVKSAISNAENNFQYDIDNLFVKEAFVGKSLVMKRFRPRAKGRASPIKKPFSRITIILDGKAKKIISEFNVKFKKINNLNRENLEPIVEDLIKSNETNFKGVGQPLRIALTGSKFGPGIYDIIISLGKNDVEKRLTNKAFS